jgi:hypothetical protein
MRDHFWPFTDVLRQIWLAVTQKVWATADLMDVTDGSLQRLTRTPYNCAPIRRAPIASKHACSRVLLLLNHTCIGVICVIRGELLFRRE